ncbi:MAG TPA: hypothetical protein VM869_21415 [Enhygromyxa sp.]|nr:hypothetical protein [Enhygromyxa sp.]
MWTQRDRAELSVWADAMQLRGDPLGELIATSLALEQQRRAGVDEAALAKVRAQLADLERVVIDPILEELLADFPEILATWSHGMIVALRVGRDPQTDRLPPRGAREALAELLRRPVARFLRCVDLRNLNGEFALVEFLLRSEDVVARPWWVALGPLPSSTMRCATIDELGLGPREKATRMLASNPQLRDLWIDGTHVALPWCDATDLEARMQILEQLLARERFDDASLTAIARALWDPHVDVRLRALDVLPRLGADAAPMIPSLLCVDVTGMRWSRAIEDVLATLARDPEVVAAVARNFSDVQSRCALWLSELRLPIARELCRPRVEAMLSGPQRAVGKDHALLVEAHRRMREPPPLAIPRPLRRIMRWLDGTWP